MKGVLLLVAILVFILPACTTSPPITSFEECVAAGNPVMESYPRQCSANGQTFVEQINDSNGSAQVGGAQFTQCPQGERPQACTKEYRPVCAFKTNNIQCITTPCPSFDAVTEGNACTACSNESTIGHYPGSCENNRFVICESLVTGFDIEQLAAENGWTCVDICPNNHDTYVTQIGAQMCIVHYGLEQINEWPLCERSSESCQCVKAYETTSEETIDDPQFRCVPEQYAERLLFRAGQEYLDENGGRGVVIA